MSLFRHPRNAISHLRFWTLFATLLLTLTLFVVHVFPAETTPEYGMRDKTPELKAFKNCRIIVSPLITIDSAVMIVDKGKIVAVGKGVAIPADAMEFDLMGKTVYPGFIDPYTDYGLDGGERQRGGRFSSSSEPSGGFGAPQYNGTRVGGNAWNDAIHAEKNWVSGFKPNTEVAKELMKSGYTVVQSAKMDGVFRGRSFVAELGDGLPNDLVLRPYSWHFLSYDKGTSRQEYPSSLMGSIALIRQTMYDTDWYTKALAAYKLNPSQKKPEYNSAIEALAQARNERMIFDSDDEMSLLRADKIAKEFGMNFVYLGSGLEYRWIKLIAATNSTIILPLNYPKAPYVKTPEDELDVSLDELRQWEMAPSDAKFLADNKIPFAFTTFKLKQKSEFLKNVRATIKRGLPVQTALAALTTVPAEICGLSDKIGTLEKGKLANFIVADSNLIQKEATVYSVWIEGNENHFEDIPKTDLRGNYRLSFSNQNFDLTIKGGADKPDGEIKLGPRPRKLKDVNIEDERIQFSLPLDTLGFKGTLRFSGAQTGKDLAGKMTTPVGDVVSWKAAFTSAYSEKQDSTKGAHPDSTGGRRNWRRGGPQGDNEAEAADDSKPDSIVSRLTYPNIAFGFTEPPKQENVLIHNATVWTSEADGILQNSDVSIVNGKIAAVGKNLTAPPGARVIDATGKHLTAGIIDEHSHIAISRGVNEGSEAVTSEVRIGDVVDPEDINVYRILAGGVTVSHLLHGSANPIGGQCQVIKMKWGLPPEEMKFKAAPPTIKFALGENVKQSNWGERYNTRYPQTRMGVETVLRDEFQTAREYEQDWKKYNSLSGGDKAKTVPPRKDIELDAIDDILNSRMFIHVHSYVQSEILMLMRVAESFGFKIQTFTHILEGYKVADEMKKHGTTANSFADWWDYKFEVYDANAYSVALMMQRGLVTGVNSDDAEMARRLNQEASKSIMYGGATEEEAIKLVTINPAIQLKVDQLVGSIKVGKDADFVIWNGDPLSTYSHVEQTWIEGRKYFDIETDKLMREEIKKEKNALIQKVLKSGGGKTDDWGAGYKHPEKEWDCDDIIDVWRHDQ